MVKDRRKSFKKRKQMWKLVFMSTSLNIGVNFLNLQIVKFYTRTKLRNLTRLTCDLRYKMGITSQKKKLKKSQSTYPNNSMPNEKKMKKKTNSKRDLKKTPNSNQVNH